MSMDEREPQDPPSVGDAWTTLQTLLECLVLSLTRGDEYGLLLGAAREAEALLARHAAGSAAIKNHLEGAPVSDAA